MTKWKLRSLRDDHGVRHRAFGLVIVQLEEQSAGFGYERLRRVGAVGNLKQKRLGKKVQIKMAEILGTEKWR